MTLVAKNPHGFEWDHDAVHQYLVIGETKVLVAWLMPESDLRDVLSGHNIDGTVIDAAIAFVHEHRADFDVRTKANA